LDLLAVLGAGAALAARWALATGFTGALAAGFFGLAATLALALGAAALAAFWRASSRLVS